MAKDTNQVQPPKSTERYSGSGIGTAANILGKVLGGKSGPLGDIQSYRSSDYDKGVSAASFADIVTNFGTEKGNLCFFNLDDIKKNGIPGNDAFDTFLAKRADNFDALSFPANSLATKLSEDIKKDLNEVFNNPPNSFVQAKETFDTAMQNMQEWVISEEGVSPIRGEIVRMDNIATSAIQGQHEKEKQALEQKFAASSALVEKLKNATPKYDDAKINTLKTEMLTALEESQKKSLAAFKETMRKVASDMQKQAETEYMRLGLIVSEYFNNETARNVIDNKAKQPAAGQQCAMTLQQSSDGTCKAIFKNIQPEDLGYSETFNKLHINKAPDGKSFSIQFPSYLFSPIFYNSPRHNTKLALLSLAHRMKASGVEEVQCTIELPQRPEDAQKLAREAYEACREAGYEPEKIEVKVQQEDGSYKTIKGTDFCQANSKFEEKAQGYANKRQELAKRQENLAAERFEAFKAFKTKHNNATQLTQVPDSSTPPTHNKGRAQQHTPLTG